MACFIQAIDNTHAIANGAIPMQMANDRGTTLKLYGGNSPRRAFAKIDDRAGTYHSIGNHLPEWRHIRPSKGHRQTGTARLTRWILNLAAPVTLLQCETTDCREGRHMRASPTALHWRTNRHACALLRILLRWRRNRFSHELKVTKGGYGEMLHHVRRDR
jgi:hypothetical protein